MSRISTTFERLKAEGRSALIAYLTVGYPTLDLTLSLVPRLAQAGCDIIELGIPFSDPLADGSVIQTASHTALQNGVTPTKCLETAAKLRTMTQVPLVFMTYYNPVLRYGLAAFSQACQTSGIDGIIVPDLPPEEADELDTHLGQRNIDSIYLLAPTSTPERIRSVAQRSRGFIYLVSLTGVTGAREALPDDLAAFVNRVRQDAVQPLCVGFGISTPQQAGSVAKAADGVIVGSRLLQVIGENDDPIGAAVNYATSLRRGVDRS